MDAWPIAALLIIFLSIVEVTLTPKEKNHKRHEHMADLKED